jgi:hypothetical protein
MSAFKSWYVRLMCCAALRWSPECAAADLLLLICAQENYFLKSSSAMGVGGSGAAGSKSVGAGSGAAASASSAAASLSSSVGSSGLRRSDLVALFSELDKDKDQKLSFNEFKQFFRNLWDAGATASAVRTGGAGNATQAHAHLLERQDSKLKEMHSHIAATKPPLARQPTLTRAPTLPRKTSSSSSPPKPAAAAAAAKSASPPKPAAAAKK